MRKILFISVALVAACSGSTQIVEVPGEREIISCATNADCPEGKCNRESGYCVRVEEVVVERSVGEVCDGLDNDADGYADEGLLGFQEPALLAEFADCSVVSLASEIVDTDTGVAFVVEEYPGTRHAEGREGLCTPIYPPMGITHQWRLVTVGNDNHVAVADPIPLADGRFWVFGFVWTGNGFGALIDHDVPSPQIDLVGLTTEGRVTFSRPVAEPVPPVELPNARMVWTGEVFSVISLRDMGVAGWVGKWLDRISESGELEFSHEYGSQLAEHNLGFSIAPMQLGGYLLAWYNRDIGPLHHELAVMPLAEDFAPSGVETGTIQHGSYLIAHNLMPTENGFILPASISMSGEPYAALFDAEGYVVEEFTPRPGHVQVVSGDTAVGIANRTAYRFTLDGRRVLDGARVPDQSYGPRFKTAGAAKFDYYYVEQRATSDSFEAHRLLRSRFGCSD